MSSCESEFKQQGQPFMINFGCHIGRIGNAVEKIKTKNRTEYLCLVLQDDGSRIWYKVDELLEF